MSDSKTTPEKGAPAAQEKPSLESLALAITTLQQKLDESQKKIDEQAKTIAEHKAEPGVSDLHKRVGDLTKQLNESAEKIKTLAKEAVENAAQAAPKTPTTKQGEMAVMSCRVKLSKDQDVPLKEVTPAEVCVLVALHHKNVGDNPVHEFGECVQTKAIQHTDPDNPKARPGHKPLFVDGKHVGSEVETKTYSSIVRNPSDEVVRLAGKYGSKRVRALFPGAIPQLPATFEEAIKLGVTMTLEDNKLSAGEIKL